MPRAFEAHQVQKNGDYHQRRRALAPVVDVLQGAR